MCASARFWRLKDPYSPPPHLVWNISCILKSPHLTLQLLTAEFVLYSIAAPPHLPALAWFTMSSTALTQSLLLFTCHSFQVSIALTPLPACLWVHPFNLLAGVKSVTSSSAWCCTFFNKLLQTFNSSYRWPLLLTSISLVLSRSWRIDSAESSARLSLFDAQLKLTYTFGLHKPFTVSVWHVGETFLLKGSCDDDFWPLHDKVVKPGRKPVGTD